MGFPVRSTPFLDTPKYRSVRYIPENMGMMFHEIPISLLSSLVKPVIHHAFQWNFPWNNAETSAPHARQSSPAASAASWWSWNWAKSPGAPRTSSWHGWQLDEKNATSGTEIRSKKSDIRGTYHFFKTQKKGYVGEYPHKIWPYMVQYLHFWGSWNSHILIHAARSTSFWSCNSRFLTIPQPTSRFLTTAEP